MTEPGITNGPVLIVEPRVLAVSTRHPLARREAISLEDLAAERVFRPAGSPPREWIERAQPQTAPSGLPIDRGGEVSTFQELLTLIAAGQGICIVAAHNTRYHPRDDVAYIPFTDAPPFQFGLVWLAKAETSKIRTFAQPASKTVADLGGPAAAGNR